MKNVFRIVPTGGTGTQLQFFCPGCKTLHALDENFGFNNDLVKPTVSPSVRVRGWLNEQITQGVCHSYITDGKIKFLEDCSHELAGQTVELKPIPKNAK